MVDEKPKTNEADAAHEYRERVSVTLPPKLLARIDAVAAAREESRSQVMARMLANDIGKEEAFLTIIANPVGREVMARILSSPKLFEVVAQLVGSELTPEERQQLPGSAKAIREIGAKERKRRVAGHEQDQPEGPAIEGA